MTHLTTKYRTARGFVGIRAFLRKEAGRSFVSLQVHRVFHYCFSNTHDQVKGSVQSRRVRVVEFDRESVGEAWSTVFDLVFDVALSGARDVVVVVGDLIQDGVRGWERGAVEAIAASIAREYRLRCMTWEEARSRFDDRVLGAMG